MASTTTVPVRCLACGAQTHKTLETIVRDGGLACACGVTTKLDVAEFGREIRDRENSTEDFVRR